VSVFSVSVIFGNVPDAAPARQLALRRNARATAERHVGYMLKKTETSNEKAGFYREQVPGLTLRQTFAGPIRGMYWADTRCFVVAGSGLYELSAGFVATSRGSLSTSTGWVEMTHGLFSLVVVDGANGYTLDLGTNVLTAITSDAFYGAKRVSFLDGKFQFVRPDSQQFYWSASVDEAGTYDALDFASAEGAPDNIVAHLVDHRELWFFGVSSTEVWSPYPNGEQVYARNNGASIEVGCAAAMTPQKIDNTIYWVGYDKLGQGIVWSAGGSSGYTPQRISSQDLEDQVAKLDDISGAYAWTYQDAGQTFYVLQIPGLESTWVYDAAVQKWHERVELEGANLKRWRADVHAFAFGLHLCGDSEGNLYEIDPYEYTNAGNPIYREWTPPHQSDPSQHRVFYNRLTLDMTVGYTDSGVAPSIEMRYSNDAGETWSAWSSRSTGKVGEYSTRVKWDRLGSARNRVFQFRCTDDCKASIMGWNVDKIVGIS
jgi:hypothetical protein